MPTVRDETEQFNKGLYLRTCIDNVHDTTPTAAQIIAATAEGATFEPSPYKIGLINDASGETNLYFVISDGTTTGWLKLTKGV